MRNISIRSVFKIHFFFTNNTILLINNKTITVAILYNYCLIFQSLLNTQILILEIFLILRNLIKKRFYSKFLKKIVRITMILRIRMFKLALIIKLEVTLHGLSEGTKNDTILILKNSSTFIRLENIISVCRVLLFIVRFWTIFHCFIQLEKSLFLRVSYQIGLAHTGLKAGVEISSKEQKQESR